MVSASVPAQRGSCRAERPADVAVSSRQARPARRDHLEAAERRPARLAVGAEAFQERLRGDLDAGVGGDEQRPPAQREERGLRALDPDDFLQVAEHGPARRRGERSGEGRAGERPRSATVAAPATLSPRSSNAAVTTRRARSRAASASGTRTPFSTAFTDCPSSRRGRAAAAS